MALSHERKDNDMGFEWRGHLALCFPLSLQNQEVMTIFMDVGSLYRRENTFLE